MESKTVIINMYAGGMPQLPPAVATVHTLKPLGLAGRLARAVLRRVSTSTVALFEDRSSLECLREADTVVLFDYKGMRPLMRYIDANYPHLRRKILFFWNILSRPSDAADLPAGWEACSFDPVDAAAAGIRYAGQFFFPELIRQPSPPTADSLCFIGRDKGRRGTLHRLAGMLEGRIKLDISIVSPLHRLMPGRYAAPLNYADYLARQSRAAALLELCRPGQHGLTLRTLEALAMGRKLVTDNAAIGRYELYDSDRIFTLPPIVDRGTAAELAQWLAAPVATPPPDLSAYSFANWLGRLVDGVAANDFR